MALGSHIRRTGRAWGHPVSPNYHYDKSSSPGLPHLENTCQLICHLTEGFSVQCLLDLLHEDRSADTTAHFIEEETESLSCFLALCPASAAEVAFWKLRDLFCLLLGPLDFV